MRVKVAITAFLAMLILSGCATKSERAGIDYKKVSAANTELGVAYLGRGKYKVAMRKLKKALQYDDNNAAAHHYIAELYRRLEEYEKSETHFQRAMELDEENSSIKNNYGVYLCSVGKYKLGLKLFNEVLHDPLYTEKGKIYENIGLCSEKQGNIKSAEKFYKKALSYNGRLPNALLGLAQIQFDRNNFVSASYYLEKRNKIAPPVPQSLWLEILIAYSKGMKSRAGSLGIKLKQYFPDSKETLLLEKLQLR